MDYKTLAAAAKSAAETRRQVLQEQVRRVKEGGAPPEFMQASFGQFPGAGGGPMSPPPGGFLGSQGAYVMQMPYGAAAPAGYASPMGYYGMLFNI